MPRVLRQQVIKDAHDPTTAGHLGVKRTKGKLAYYWYEVKQDVSLYIRCCDICEADKRPPKPPRGSMGNVTAGAP